MSFIQMIFRNSYSIHKYYECKEEEERKMTSLVALCVGCIVFQYNCTMIKMNFFKCKIHSIRRYRLMTYSLLSFYVSSHLVYSVSFSPKWLLQIDQFWSRTELLQHSKFIEPIKFHFLIKKMNKKQQNKWMYTLLECVKCRKFTHFFYLFIFIYSFDLHPLRGLNSKL